MNWLIAVETSIGLTLACGWIHCNYGRFHVSGPSVPQKQVLLRLRWHWFENTELSSQPVLVVVQRNGKHVSEQDKHDIRQMQQPAPAIPLQGGRAQVSFYVILLSVHKCPSWYWGAGRQHNFDFYWNNKGIKCLVVDIYLSLRMSSSKLP